MPNLNIFGYWLFMNIMIKDFATREWQFSAGDDALSNMASIQIVLWQRGMCVCGHTPDAKVNIANSYSFNRPVSLIQLENHILNLPVLAGPQPVQNIWLVEPRHVSFPIAIYDENAAADWLRKMHFIEADEAVHTDRLESIQSAIAYPLKVEIKNMLHQYFKEADFRLLTAEPFFGTESLETPVAQLILTGNSYVLGMMYAGKMLLLQTRRYETVEDLAYPIALVSEKNQVPAKEWRIVLQGVDADLVGLSQQLQAYYPGTEQVPDNDTAYLSFLNRLT